MAVSGTGVSVVEGEDVGEGRVEVEETGAGEGDARGAEVHPARVNVRMKTNKVNRFMS